MFEDFYAPMTDKAKSLWKPIETYDPDQNPSSGEIYTKTEGNIVKLAVRVRGLGVLVLRATSPSSNRLVVSGVSLVTKDELGYSPNV